IGAAHAGAANGAQLNDARALSHQSRIDAFNLGLVPPWLSLGEKQAAAARQHCEHAQKRSRSEASTNPRQHGGRMRWSLLTPLQRLCTRASGEYALGDMVKDKTRLAGALRRRVPAISGYPKGPPSGRALPERRRRMRTTGPNPMVWHAFLVRLRGTRTAKIGLSAGQRSGSRAPPCLQWRTSPQSNLTRVVRRLARLRITSCRRI